MDKTISRSEIAWLRALVFTIYGTSVLVYSYFPLFYAELGFSNSQIGLLYALGPMISLVANLFWSVASDKYRTIKKIMLILLIGQIIMTFILSVSTTFSVIIVIITIFYFFYYPVFPLSDTIGINAAKNHGKSFISIRVFGSIGFAASAIAIGYVLSAIGSEQIMKVSIAIAAVCFILTIFIKDQNTPVAKMNLSGIVPVLRQKELLWFFACVFFLALGTRMNDAFLTISLNELGASEDLIGWAMLASAGSEIPVFLYLSFKGEKYKELPLLVLASLIFAVRFFLMSTTTSPEGIVMVQLMHGITFGIFYVTAIRMLTRLIPDQFRATGMALFTIVWSSLSGLISGTFGGIVFEHLGRDQFYLIAMVTSIIACLGFASRYLYRGPKAPPAAAETYIAPESADSARNRDEAL
ncbi:putative nucleoside transporter YegT [compost metagenome]